MSRQKIQSLLQLVTYIHILIDNLPKTSQFAISTIENVEHYLKLAQLELVGQQASTKKSKFANLIPDLENDKVLNLILNQLPIVLFFIDSQWVLKVAKGKGLESLYGCGASPNIGKSVLELYSGYPEILETISKSMEVPQAWVSRLNDNNIIYKNWGLPLKNRGMLGIAIDISKHDILERKSEIVLRKHNQVLKSFDIVLELAILKAESDKCDNFPSLLKRWKIVANLVMNSYYQSGLVVPLKKVIPLVSDHLNKMGYFLKIEDLNNLNNVDLNPGIALVILITELAEICESVQIFGQKNNVVQLTILGNKNSGMKLGKVVDKILRDLNSAKRSEGDHITICIAI